MKTLVAIALLAGSLSVSAEEPKEMYMPNDAGGFVVLTIEPCAFEQAAKEYPYRAYATESSDIVNHAGCWTSPDTAGAGFDLLVAEEGAGPAPTMRLIPMVNTWWEEGAKATFVQSNFRPEKLRYLSNGKLESAVKKEVDK